MGSINLSEQSIEQFKKIILKDYGVSLSDEEAATEATELIEFLYDQFKMRKLNKQNKRVYGIVSSNTK